MSILKKTSTTTTFTLTLEDIQNLVVNDLGYMPSTIHIDKTETENYDPMDKYAAPTHTFTGLKITITE